MILSGELAVMQAPLFDSIAFDPFALFDDGFCPAEVDIDRRYVVQAVMIALVIIMLDKRLNLHLRITG